MNYQITESEISFLRRAIELAQFSKSIGGKPFGAVLVNNESKIVMESYDKRHEIDDPTAHPEIYIISQYCRQSKKIHLKDYTLITSTEPCTMCSGAIRSARIPKVIFSVPQNILNKYSGGKPKVNCGHILSLSRGEIKIIGSQLIEEGISVIKDYNFEGI